MQERQMAAVQHGVLKCSTEEGFSFSEVIDSDPLDIVLQHDKQMIIAKDSFIAHHRLSRECQCEALSSKV
jgi:hypothetical protein